MLIDFHCGAKKVWDSDENVWGHFLAEGFGKILQVDPKVFVHWDLGTWGMPPANLIHPGGEISKPLVDTNLAGNSLYVGCREQFQFICSTVKEDAGYFIPIGVGHHGILVLRKMFLHPVCLDVPRDGFLQARSCLRPVLAWAGSCVICRRRCGCRCRHCFWPRFQQDLGCLDNDWCCTGSCGRAVTSGRFWWLVPWRLSEGARGHRLHIHVVLRVRLLSFNVLFGERLACRDNVTPGLAKKQLRDIGNHVLVRDWQLIKDKAEVSSQIIPCLLVTWCELKAWSANVPPTVDGEYRCRPVRREPDAIFFRVGEMPLVSEFHCIGVPLCTQPWEPGVGKPDRAACQSLELWFQCIKELVKDGVNAIVSRPGRGGETGRLQIQFLGFPDIPSQVAQSSWSVGQCPLGPSYGQFRFWAIPFSPTNSFPNQDKCRLIRASGPCRSRASAANSIPRLTRRWRVFPQSISWINSETYPGLRCWKCSDMSYFLRVCLRPVISAHDESETRIQMTGLGVTPCNMTFSNWDSFGKKQKLRYSASGSFLP